jgi:hypothetical protein
MANTNQSNNMLLPVPAVGTDAGPQYATDLNNCLTIIDSHDHSQGHGVQIGPSGLNINSDLSFAGNNAINIRTARFTPQNSILNPVATPSDIGCLYEVRNDLYFSNGAGLQIQITNSSGVAGSPGSIANLTPPASASYVALNETFVFQADTNIAANLDVASIVLRNTTVSSTGLTLSPPSPIGANYTLTLPAVPAQQSFMTLDASGAMAAPWTVDNSTIKIQANQLVVQPAKLQILQSHQFEANGNYSGASVFPQTAVDGYMFFNFNATIVAIWIYNITAGSAGTTEFDLKLASPGGSFTSILSTTGKITSAATSGIWTDSNAVITAQTGVIKPTVITTSIAAGQALKFDILQTMTNARDCGVIVFFNPR